MNLHRWCTYDVTTGRALMTRRAVRTDNFHVDGVDCFTGEPSCQNGAVVCSRLLGLYVYDWRDVGTGSVSTYVIEHLKFRFAAGSDALESCAQAGTVEPTTPGPLCLKRTCRHLYVQQNLNHMYFEYRKWITETFELHSYSYDRN